MVHFGLNHSLHGDVFDDQVAMEMDTECLDRDLWYHARQLYTLHVGS